MRTAAIAQYGAFDDKYSRMTKYLSSEGGYWKDNDRWYLDADSFMKAGIPVPNPGHWLLADFGSYKKGRLKEEMKYFLLHSMKDGIIEAVSVYRNYRQAISNIGRLLSSIRNVESFNGLDTCDRELKDAGLNSTERLSYLCLKHSVTRLITDYYGDRDEMENDIWRASRIPGTKVSAAGKREKVSISFERIPTYYREMVKRFMSRLVVKRSWSYCVEMMMYIRYFSETFYAHGYTDGFLERLARQDIEKYLSWVAGDYEGKNATFRSKAVSFIRQYIDYIQLAEYPQAPQKDVNRLIFEDDIPKRERPADTMGKVKYVPEPVRVQLDACISEIEPMEMMSVYILLRESGWRGTDVLNLRYNSCLEYLWNGYEKEYIPYLCGEITKTGIPLLKIPIRKEVADMVKKLAKEAVERSTDDNNPDKYLFNTYEGRYEGFPLSKPAFSAAVQELIDRKGILDGDGKLYHFKAHALRHTRALEYTEQGMPIGIIQQILGHCSLQMTLHYAKVSENALYKKWKETEKLNLLHLESMPPNAYKGNGEEIRYEFIRKNLDAVRIPFGVCFKPSKLPCRQQISHCLDCANFCTSRDNITEYEKEIERVREQLEISKMLGRGEWEEKNRNYLEILKRMLARIQKEGLIHKNGSHREECDG
ncbi:Site-specific recombinase XerD [Anaerovirgula multivorans]|uniref:Site-specific recombinase XerD n=1 Tax=Anaerovirgula multivorans TaxID=312168 RepID=A0A239LGE1_9FIRM|nr:tyrosine-type recombinase/integrase [Anaerovirgula multivorans]SNT29002.1 Site-specific recombinase XerD [Anaerovirgula multivorans]